MVRNSEHVAESATDQSWAVMQVSYLAVAERSVLKNVRR